MFHDVFDEVLGPRDLKVGVAASGVSSTDTDVDGRTQDTQRQRLNAHNPPKGLKTVCTEQMQRMYEVLTRNCFATLTNLDSSKNDTIQSLEEGLQWLESVWISKERANGTRRAL